MDTPSGQLAAKIMDQLILEGILTPEDPAKLLSKLADGQLRSEDWRLAVELAVNLQSVANLVPANGCGKSRIHFTGHFTIVETLVLQRLLHSLNQLIGAHQHRRSNKDQDSDLDFHSVILTLCPFAYSALSPAVSATADFRWLAASR